jgi:hypothetical protein
MLDLSNPEHRRFVEVLLNRLGHSNENKAPTTTQTGSKGQRSKEEISNQQQSKKRVKQINLFSKEGQAKETITLPGQHKYCTYSSFPSFHCEFMVS